MKTTDDDARQALDLRLEAYLDGTLGPAEVRATERLLADPDVATALAEAIALRELLASAPPEVPPDWLEDWIIDTLGVAEPERASGRGGRLGQARRAFDGATVALRTPSRTSGGREAMAGMGTMRYALGPLSLIGAGAQREAPKRSWWRRVVRLGGGR